MAGYRFTFYDIQGTSYEVQRMPSGYDNPVIVLERHESFHGLFWDYGLNPLTFYGEDADYITAEYEQNGVEGYTRAKIEYQCTDNGPYEEITIGQLDYKTYNASCGLECGVTIEVEDTRDVITFMNNYEQKVDLNKNIALDGTTPLDEYDGLNFDLTIPSRELRQRLQGTAKPGPFQIFPINVTTTGLFVTTSVRPSYINNQIAELERADLVGASQYRVNPQNDPPLHPFVFSEVLELEQNPGCSAGIFNYKIRLKGHVAETGSNNRIVDIQLVFNKGEYNDTTDPAIEKISIAPSQTYLGPDGPSLDFDQTFEGVVPISPGEELFVRIFSLVIFNAAGRTTNLYVTWDEETSIEIYVNTSCAPSVTKAFMINETVSRVSESITSGALRFFSDTFGRLDSQPYTRPVDSCAGLFSVTNGLNIRRKNLPDGTQPGYFTTMRDLFEDLNSMWNIGLTIEPDVNRDGFNRLRFENWEWFYQNTQGLIFNNSVTIRKKVDLSRVYNQLRIGFEKWEAQQNTGLDEFMTQRSYKVDINSISNVLEMMCQMILSTYCIEETRRLQDNTQDWTYDNDTFGFVLLRDAATQLLRVELMSESAVTIENVLNSGSNYNVRVSPARNAMRWFNFIMQSLKELDVSKKMRFTEGMGNYIAAYRLTNCAIEGSQLEENEDIDINNFASAADAQPLTYAETDTFEHPFSFATFRQLKDNVDLQYQSILYFCNTIPRQGWIKRIEYRLGEGAATITVIPKNTLQIPTPIPPCDATVTELAISDCGEICVRFDWVDAIGDNWRWSVLDGDTMLPVEQGTTANHFVILENLAAGNYVFQVIPYCGNASGQNIAQYGFNATEPVFRIQLWAYKIFAQSIQEWKWKLVAEPVGGGVFPVHFEFFFKRCSFFNGNTHCNSPALGEWGAIYGDIGQTNATGDTWGAETEDSVLESINIRLASLSGLTPDQIIKRPDQTWNLIFE